MGSAGDTQLHLNAMRRAIEEAAENREALRQLVRDATLIRDSLAVLADELGHPVSQPAC